jgi:hypothetical protein
MATIFSGLVIPEPSFYAEDLGRWAKDITKVLKQAQKQLLAENPVLDSTTVPFVLTTTGTESPIYQLSLAARVLGPQGILRCRAAGQWQNTGTIGGLTLGIQLGATMLWKTTGPSQNAATPLNWLLEFTLANTGAANNQVLNGFFAMVNEAAGDFTGSGDIVSGTLTRDLASFRGIASEDLTQKSQLTVLATLPNAEATDRLQVDIVTVEKLA